MFKVALINPIQFTKYSQPPLVLALIAAVLEREGYQVTMLEANALESPHKRLKHGHDILF